MNGEWRVQHPSAHTHQHSGLPIHMLLFVKCSRHILDTTLCPSSQTQMVIVQQEPSAVPIPRCFTNTLWSQVMTHHIVNGLESRMSIPTPTSGHSARPLVSSTASLPNPFPNLNVTNHPGVKSCSTHLCLSTASSRLHLAAERAQPLTAYLGQVMFSSHAAGPFSARTSCSSSRNSPSSGMSSVAENAKVIPTTWLVIIWTSVPTT